MHTIVVIEDLQEKQAIDIHDSYQWKMSKQMITDEHKLLDAKPRDVSVWSKTKEERYLLRRCIMRWKTEMLNDYPFFTNKSDLHNTKALLWG